jgi:hypothetical protein
MTRNVGSRIQNLLLVAVAFSLVVICGVGVMLKDDPVGGVILGTIWILIGSGWLRRFYNEGRLRQQV